MNQFISWSSSHVRDAVDAYLSEMVWKKLQDLPVNDVAKEKAEETLRKNLQVLEKALEERSTLVGEHITLCDLVIAEDLLDLELVEFDFGELVNIQQWQFYVKQNVSSWDKVHQFFYQVFKPAVQKAL